jgi:chemosensory pili system protein ChpA (sensor histidine kinase/response regulator)
VARAARDAAQAVVRDDAAAGAQALVDLSQTAPAASAPLANALASEDNEEDDLLDIFLEEAREVVGNGLEAVGLLQVQPADLEHLTTLRRAFHTLKGSSRMVGLGEFGEAAWAMEQLVNAVLAEQQPAHPDMLRLSGEAMGALSRWVEDIAARTDVAWSAQPFRASAEAWRNQAQYCHWACRPRSGRQKPTSLWPTCRPSVPMSGRVPKNPLRPRQNPGRRRGFAGCDRGGCLAIRHGV